MNLDALYSELTLKPEAKLALVVLDGLGDLATGGPDSSTPLEAALTPNLDALTEKAAQGRMIPVAPGITPGSGPGHLALFGYDPLDFQVGRGVIEALGLGLELKAGDVAARANFCTLNAKGIVTDRRAGRIDTSVCEELCALLSKNVKKVGDAQVIIKAGKGHRFVVVFRGKGLEGPLSDADPHREGAPIPSAHPIGKGSVKAQKMARLIKEFYKLALPILARKKPANGFLMRGIAHQPHIPTFEERYQLRAACIAVYPMYKGLAQLVGMTKLEGAQTIAEQFERYLAEYDNYDYFFIHYKYPDMYVKYFGADYKPEPYIEAEYQRARDHKYYMTARLICVNDIYSFDPDAKVDLDDFVDIIGRNFNQPKEGLGLDNTPSSHMWRTLMWPTRFL